MSFDEFIQKSSKAELTSLVRRYENSLKHRKKFVSLEGFYEKEQQEAIAKFDKAVEEVKKVVTEDDKKDKPLKEVRK